MLLQILDAEPQAASTSSALTIATPGDKSVPTSSHMQQIIQDYRAIVNLMAGLLLRLDQEGPSEGLSEQLQSAVRQSVSSCNPASAYSQSVPVLIGHYRLHVACHSSCDSHSGFAPYGAYDACDMMHAM